MPLNHSAIHIPVLQNEVLEWLQPKSDGLYVDGTLGLGGHTQAILEKTAPGGRVIGFEWDEDAAVKAGERLSWRRDFARPRYWVALFGAKTPWRISRAAT